MRRAVLCLVGCLALGASLWAQETSLTDLHDKTVLFYSLRIPMTTFSAPAEPLPF